MTRRRITLAVLTMLILMGLGAVALLATHRGSGAVLALGRDGPRAPDAVRIKVEVLNATRVRGLARRATVHLRDRGFDVVEIGTAPEQRDNTLVLDRSGNPEWAALVADALGAGSVESRPDSSRYLDITVLVGGDWTPPAEPFYP